jgi:SLOG cluster3 family
MAFDPIKQRHPAIFLSASIPTRDRGARYYDTSDVIAIRECVKALVAAAVPRHALIWGGHPSITPMIRLLAEANPTDVNDYFVLYQSCKFKNIAPKDNEFFRHVKWVDSPDNSESSLELLRTRMLTEPNYVAGVFIGGMDGIEHEFKSFIDINPHAGVYPIASTGGAAKLLFEEGAKNLSLGDDLQYETSYPYLFRRLLKELPF